MKERTASAPGELNLTFAHYKTTSTDPTTNRIDTFVRNRALTLQQIQPEWKNICDLMIPKRSGLTYINKMRIIQKMDAEFNNINKLCGKRIMAHAEKHKLLSHDQYGSRKRHQSITCCLNKVCLMDLLRQKGWQGQFQ